MTNANDLLIFWFKEIEPSCWYAKSESLDRMITERFGDIHQSANRCELSAWRETPRGRLAEIIVLDQFSRNIFRDQPGAFASDPLALALAQEAVRQDADQDFNPEEKSFLYMPFMHSESLLIHEEAVQLFDQPGLQKNLEFEYRHKQIIEQFGRYPHRNSILGRESTAEEVDFLKQPGSVF